MTKGVTWGTLSCKQLPELLEFSILYLVYSSVKIFIDLAHIDQYYCCTHT